MKRLRAVSCYLLALLALPSLAYGYIDPGAGSMLLQLLVGGVAGLLTLATLFKQRIARFLGLKKGDEDR